MPRAARGKSETGIYHIMLRGINRQTIFEENKDCIKFLETLQRFKEKSCYKVYAYCLMGNHVHLLLKEGNEKLDIVTRRIGASYVYWYNHKYDRCGHLIQDRYKSEPVEDESYFLSVLRYIHKNPVKAGIVNNIKDYPWSSYHEYIGRSEIADTEFPLGLFSDEKDKAIESFIAFHNSDSHDVCLDMDTESEDTKKLTDSNAAEIIKDVCHISHCSEFKGIEKDKRSEYIRSLNEMGLSSRQISRLTGLSRNTIMKA